MTNDLSWKIALHSGQECYLLWNLQTFEGFMMYRTRGQDVQLELLREISSCRKGRVIAPNSTLNTVIPQQVQWVKFFSGYLVFLKSSPASWHTQADLHPCRALQGPGAPSGSLWLPGVPSDSLGLRQALTSPCYSGQPSQDGNRSAVSEPIRIAYQNFNSDNNINGL